jgi:hypothetical protein
MFRHHAPVLIESEILILQTVQSGGEQPCRRQQNQRERGLEHHSVFRGSEPVRPSTGWRREALRSDLLVWPSMREQCRRQFPCERNATKANSSTGREGDALMGTPASR